MAPTYTTLRMSSTLNPLSLSSLSPINSCVSSGHNIWSSFCLTESFASANGTLRAQHQSQNDARIRDCRSKEAINKYLEFIEYENVFFLVGQKLGECLAWSLWRTCPVDALLCGEAIFYKSSVTESSACRSVSGRSSQYPNIGCMPCCPSPGRGMLR